MDKSSLAKPWNAGSLLILGLGSGILAGFVEGAGLMIFQRINWARWGPMMHVSWEIVWISPIVDAILFLSLALICSLVSRLAPRLPADASAGLPADISHRVRLAHLDQPPLLACMSTPGIGCRRGLHSLVRKTGRRVPAILEENYAVDGRSLGARIRRDSRRQVAA